MNCPKCGFTNGDSAETCANCHAKLHDIASAQPASDAAPSTNSAPAEIAGNTVAASPATMASQSPAQPANTNTEAQTTATEQSSAAAASSTSQLNPNHAATASVINNPNPVATSNLSTTPTSSTASASPVPKKSKKALWFILAGVIAVAAIAAVVIIFLLNRKPAGDDVSLEETLTSSKTFFLSNEDGRYALFDIDGKRLTEFEFDYASDFVNGAAEVENADGKEGAIGADGKMVINFDQCEYLYSAGPLFRCVDPEYNDVLYDAKGKELARADDLEATTEIGDYTYTLVQTEDEFSLYDYKGNVLKTFAATGSSKDKPYIEAQGDYVSLYYDNTTYLFDVAQSKLLLTLPNTQYCLKSINKFVPGELILTSQCVLDYSGKETEKTFSFVKDGAVKYTKTTTYHDGLTFNGNSVVFNDGDDDYVLDPSGNTAFDLGYTIFKDYNNYIQEINGGRDGADLYVDGQKKETFQCSNIQGDYAVQGIYLLDGCKGEVQQAINNYDKMYIHYNGTRLNDKKYMFAYPFDQNGYAVVSEDGEKYYLINTKGEKSSADYLRDSSAMKIYAIEGTDKLYRGNDTDDTEAIFEAGGDKLISGSDISAGETKVGAFALIEKDGEYIVYDLKKRAEVGSYDTEPEMDDYYFVIESNGKEQYYSYTTGKMFHEV